MRRNFFTLTVPLLCPAMLLAQTESEPNDNIAQADTLTLGNAMSGDIGLAPCGSGTTDDYFMLNLPQDGSIDINTVTANTGAGIGTLRVYVYNSGGGQVFLTDHAAGANGVPTSVTNNHTCLGKGIYYISLQRLTGDCYTYSLTVTQTTPVYGDDLEPNDSFTDADADPLLAANTNTDGHIDFSYDNVNNDDRYRIQTTNDGVVNVTISAETPNAASTVRVYVFNSGGGQIGLFDATMGANSVPVSTSASFTCYGQDYYYFSVQSLGACGVSYRLSYTLTPPIYANDAEPNNTFANAVPLAHNTYTEGHLNFSNAGDNDDRYVVSTPAEGTMTVTMIAENTAGGSVRVYVYNDAFGQIDLFDSSVGANNDDDTTTASFTCYGQGTYDFLVQGIGGCGMSYKLKYQTTGAVYANDVEPDNSLAQALPLPPNTFTEGHIAFNNYGDNTDYYSIQTPAEGTLNVTLIGERVPATDGNVRVYVYNSNGGQIDLFDSPAGGSSHADTTTASFNCYGQGGYYFQVASIGGCGISYKLKYTITPAVYANDVEPNNDLPTALANPVLAPNVYTEGHINFNNYGDNTDDYTIQTAGDGTLNFTMIAERVPAAAGSVRMYLYNSGGGQIGLFDASAGGGSDDDTTSASFTCMGQSLYYLSVQSIGGCGISYKLGYTLTPPVYDDDLEPDNTLATAIALNPDSANSTGHLNFANIGDNNDYFRVNLPALGNIHFDFLAENAAGGTARIYLYNGGGGQLALQDVPAGAAHTPVSTPVAFNSLAAGTYYLLVQSIGGCGISYRFNCNDADGDGTCNYFDLCPGGPEPGTACNDGTPCTINDVIQPNCICAGTFQDADSDGTCDANDGCPNDPNKIAPGVCGCSNPEPGAACNDNNVCTVNDVIGANCACAGTFQDSDSDGTCDANDGCPNDPNKIAPGVCGCSNPEPGAACNDNNVCTVNDVIGANCACAGTFQDSDSDGTCDANDGCPNDPNKIAPGTCGCGNPEPGAACDDNNPNTINDLIGANCICAGTLQGTDCLGVPGGSALPGTACDDLDPCTLNDTWSNACVCVGTAMVCNDNNACTSDACAGGVCVYTPLPDGDGDGTCDAQDGCPTDPNKIAPGICGCGIADTDSDADGTPNCNDGCPNDPNKIAPGICGCGVADTDSDADGTPNCNDGCPNDPNKIAPGICGCGVADADSDGDGTANCNDGCPNDPNKIAPGICGCGVADTDSDGDGVANCNDNCPNVAGQIGSSCDDNDPNTINDVLNASCVCAGTSGTCPFNQVALTLNTDANGAQTSWDIVNSGSTTAVCSGSGYASSSIITVTCCLPDGCYDLRVFDSFGDGINPGGFVLVDANNKRIVDNAGNGPGFTTLSKAASSFCVPLGTDALTAGSCDVENAILASTVLQAQLNPAVTAEFGHSNAMSGYQFWVFNPNGGFSRRIFFSHAAPGAGWPVGTPASQKAAYFKLSSMTSTAPVIPSFTLLNVRVRSRVNGVYSEFGAACRLKIDPLANCGTTQLTTTANPIVSCGATGLNRLTGVIWSNAVAGANKYQFQFVNANTNVLLRYIASPTRSLNMNTWGSSVARPTCNVPYNVLVRISFDDGDSYCPFGPVCQVTFGCNPSDDDRSVDAPTTDGLMHMWPNPNDGTRLYFTIDQLKNGTATATVDIYDIFGKRVHSEGVPVDGVMLNTVISLDNGIAKGLYMVTVTAGEESFTQRLVIQ